LRNFAVKKKAGFNCLTPINNKKYLWLFALIHIFLKNIRVLFVLKFVSIRG